MRKTNSGYAVRAVNKVRKSRNDATRRDATWGRRPARATPSIRLPSIIPYLYQGDPRESERYRGRERSMRSSENLAPLRNRGEREEKKKRMRTIRRKKSLGDSSMTNNSSYFQNFLYLIFLSINYRINCFL